MWWFVTGEQQHVDKNILRSFIRQVGGSRTGGHGAAAGEGDNDRRKNKIWSETWAEGWMNMIYVAKNKQKFPDANVRTLISHKSNIFISRKSRTLWP